MLFCSGFISLQSQINTDRVLTIGKNALYFDDYVLSIQYFNQVIRSKPYLAEPYQYRGLAKLYLDDFQGAEADLTRCIEINPFIVNSYLFRGYARQNQGNYIGAIEDYNRGLISRPEDKQLLLYKGIAYVQNKEYDSAITTLSTLIGYQPRYVQAYITRGSVYAEKGDTIHALEDFNKSLELDKYFAPAYAQRGILYYQQEKYSEALADYKEAIRLEPKQIGYYINSGLIKYYLNDLRGAMADYDAVIILDSRNTIGRFNRGLLRAQVGDVQRAVEDFNVVINNEPDNFMAIYNRAILNEELRNYRDAIADLNLVLGEYPYFVTGYYFRSEIKRAMNDVRGADKDYWDAYEMEQKLKQEKARGKIVTGKGVFEPNELAEKEAEINEKNTRERSDKNIEKFNRLVVYDKEEESRSSYKNEIRGRVQDRQVKVDLEPEFVITYYEKPEDIDKTTTRFNKTISDYNALMIHKLQLKVVNKEAAISDQQAEYHFHSIGDYSLTIDRNPGDADAYFGRALDYMVLQDLSEALIDFTHTVELRPDFILAYFNRAVVRSKLMQIENFEDTSTGNDMQGLSLKIQTQANKSLQSASNLNNQPKVDYNIPNPIKIEETRRTFEYEQIIRDYDRITQLNPDFVYAYYNRANIRCFLKDFRSALVDYNEAITRNPYFAEAYFNRGITRLLTGDTERGINDLSKAGELGIIEAYSIIKKMTAE